MRRVLTLPRENWRTILKVLGTVALIIVIVPLIAHVQPGLVGADQSYVVQSGSMEPTLPVGAVIFVDTDASAGDIEEGDIITFTQGRSTRTTTHRVHEKHTATVDGQTSVRFTTKGDANENVDPDPVYSDQIVGEVMFSIPYLGRVIALGGTTVGWALLVVVPVTLLLMDGLWQIYLAFEPEDNGE